MISTLPPDKWPHLSPKKRKSLEQLHNNPQIQKNRAVKLKNYYAKPEVRMVRSIKMKELWKNKDFRQKTIKVIINRNKDKKIRENLSKSKKEWAKTAEGKAHLKKILIIKNTDIRFNPLAGMDMPQRKKYQLLRRKGCPKDEAIRKAKRIS